MNTLSGRIALVTGASGALGSTMSIVLKVAGARVAGTYLSRPPEGKLAQSLDLAIRCVLDDEESVRSCFEGVKSEIGTPDIIVHCAGGFRSDGPLEKTSLETWNAMISMNLTSSFLVLREGMRLMRDKSYGRLLLVAAQSAFVSGPGAVAYKASKGAIRVLVETAHAERRGRGITVNALAPAMIDTPQNRADMPDADHSTWVSPRSIADVVVSLCSESGGSVSGAILPFP